MVPLGTHNTPKITFKATQTTNSTDSGLRFASALEQFLIAVGEPLDRPISIVTGNRQHHRGSLITGFYPEVDTRPIDEAHRYRRPDLAQLRSDASPWVAAPEVSPRPLAALLKGSEGGVTFRPNWVHHENESWEGAKVLFAEWDDLPLDDQERRIADLKARGLGPTAIVFSGSKSLHCYWALEELVTDSEQWKSLMAWIAVALGSDPAIVTLHREMRLPGAYRLKDGEWREQALVEVSPENRYDLAKIEALLQELCPLPHGMSDERFRDWKRAKAGQQRDNYDGPTPQDILTRDYGEWHRQQQEARARLAQERAARRGQMSVTGQVDLSDLISQAEDRLGWDAFLPYIQDYDQPHGGKARCLPVFRTGSGSKSAFISEHGGKILYHDPNSGEKAIGGFNFWLYVTRGFGAKPTGKDFVDAAKEFCRIAGIEVPEWKPRPVAPEGAESDAVTDSPVDWAKIAERAKERYLQRQTYTPDLITEGDHLGEIPSSGWVAVKAPLGSGKTHQIIAMAEEWGGGLGQFGHRNSYLRQTISRYQANGVNVSHIRDDLDKYDILNPDAKLAGCFDSLGKIRKDWSRTRLIFDEAVAGVAHLLIGGTLRGSRGFVLDGVMAAITGTDVGGVLLDGNLSNATVAWFEAISGQKILKIEHKQPAPVRLNVQLAIVEGREDNAELPLQRIRGLLQEGENLAIFCEAKSDVKALEAALGGDYKVLALHGDVSGEKWAQEYISDPELGQTLEREKVRVLAYTSTLSCGCDIGGDWFDRGLAILRGILPTCEQTQGLRRVRQLTDWVVYCPRYAQSQDIGQKSAFGGTVARYTTEALLEQLYLTLSPEARQLMEQQGNPILAALDSPIQREICELRADRNFERQNTRECLQWLLEQQGHDVTTVMVPQDSALDDVRDIKSDIRRSEAQRIFDNCGDPTPMPKTQAEKLAKGDGASFELRLQAERTLFLCRLPGLEDSPFWCVDIVEDLLRRNKRALGQIERFWLSQNLDVARQRAEADIVGVLEGFSWAGDLNQDYARLKLLQCWGVLALIGDGEWYTSESEVIKSAYERAKRSRKAKVLGLAPASGDTPIKWLKRLLKRMFDCVVTTQRIKTQGEKRDTQQWCFGLPRHAELLPFIDRRMSELSQKLGENLEDFWGKTALDSLEIKRNFAPGQSLTQQDFQPFSDSTYKTEVCGMDNPPENCHTAPVEWVHPLSGQPCWLWVDEHGGQWIKFDDEPAWLPYQPIAA